MTRHTAPPPGSISYEQWLRSRIAEPGIICGPPVAGAPSFWQDLFPVLKPREIRELERQAREPEPELEIG